MQKKLRNQLIEEIILQFNEYYVDWKVNKKLLQYERNHKIVNIELCSVSVDKLYFQISLSAIYPEISQIKKIIYPEIPTQSVIYKTQEKTLDKNDFGYQKYFMGWAIFDDTSMIKMFNDHTEFMENVGNDFLNRFGTLEGIHENINLRFLDEFSFNVERNNATNLKGLFGDRVIYSGLITAHLLNYLEMEELYNKYSFLYNHKNFNQSLKKIADHFGFNFKIENISE